MIGVLGGMGPLATMDFLSKLIALTPATCDQEHFSTLTYSFPDIPDRSTAILGGGPSPLDDMCKGISTLNAANVACIAIPCNTAHYWLEELQSVSTVPILNIVKLTSCSIDATSKKIGILATSGTIKASLYQRELTYKGYIPLIPPPEYQVGANAAIAAAKAGDVGLGRTLLTPVADALRHEGADQIIMACTEISIILVKESGGSDKYLDATKSLAKACINFMQELKKGDPAPKI